MAKSKTIVCLCGCGREKTVRAADIEGDGVSTTPKAVRLNIKRSERVQLLGTIGTKW